MENTPINPLNTGNGVPASTNPVSPAAAQQGMPVTPPAPTPASPTAPTSSNMMIEKALAMKKYIIAGVAVVALLVTVYMAYSYFTGISSAVTEVKDGAVDLNNKLSAPSTTTDTTDKTKLNNVVNELKDQYKTDNSATTTPTTPATTDTKTSTPPGMNIEIAPTTDRSTTTDTSTTTTTTTTDTGGVKR